MIWLTFIVAAYLIGSIPFGVLIGKAKGIDIRAHGSKNIGATNVGRVLGKKLGLLCFFLDVLKGAAPVLIAGIVTGVIGRDVAQLSQAQMWLWLAVACAAVLGHMFSILIGFRGGKGVATGFGAMLAIWPLLTFTALAALCVWLIALRLFKYVSLASMLGALTLPLGYLATIVLPDVTQQPLGETAGQIAHGSPPLICTLLIALLIVYRHRGNIARIRRGEEPKISSRKK